MTANNRLHLEHSPYLRQHKDNPVWWQAWGEPAFAQARREDKPIFLSVGYATCHWCHVMEGDSFEQQDIADILNAAFVAIKVDREERPDVDALYMTAVQALTERGGWPMTLVLTPEGEPFFAGTFIPRAPLKDLLQRIRALWHSPSRAKILQTGAQLRAHLQSLAHSPAHSPVRSQASASPAHHAHHAHQEPDSSVLQAFFAALAAHFDEDHGGFGTAPKFPPAMSLLALLRYYKRSQDPAALKIITVTLDALARAGVCDQLGGGFHRYATDAAWLIPHFEKMLYDNALLSWAYAEAYQLTGKLEYARVLRQTLDYVLGPLQAAQGGFYAGEDADSEKTEGKFYVWAYDEVKTLLREDEFALVVKVFGLSRKGNFDTSEHSEHEVAAGMQGLSSMNILSLSAGVDLGSFSDREQELWQAALAKMRARRASRERPFLNAQILCGWNGLMIAALAQAARTLEEPRYLAAAQTAARFISQTLLRPTGELWRQCVEGQVAIRGQLEDYSYLIFACLELYQSDFNPEWLQLARRLQSRQDALFWDASEGCYFDTDGQDPCLLLRTKSFYDYATPAGNSMAAYNLLRLAAYGFDWQKLRQQAASIFRAVGARLFEQPTAFPLLLVALDFYLDASKEIAILGPRSAGQVQEVLGLLHAAYLPNTVVAQADAATGAGLTALVPLLQGRGLVDGQPTLYVCSDQVCWPPTSDPQQALRWLEAHRPLL